MGGGTTRNI